MAIEQTIAQSINMMVENTQIVFLTVMSEAVLYSGIQFKGWWSKK